MNKPSPEQLEFLDSLIHIVDTRCHDGYFGAMADCRIAYDPAARRTICVSNCGWFPIISEESEDNARIGALWSVFYRNFECNANFVPFKGEKF